MPTFIVCELDAFTAWLPRLGSYSDASDEYIIPDCGHSTSQCGRSPGPYDERREFLAKHNFHMAID